ncbi:uncharacterized protein A1O9_03266 [Exophiala aquamarina CBS 119918]|uniref:Uncharacterized protein n=1 Tax=Exophiala aquamarina CBS 119918 TaxID=1182545 RepID=A0A072PPM7_9EURO|nr:uncharacterized protein A1O9_03266 [Exophiala aquamarina CBS 119918]KEF61697.1 hypothetical protein A1O9_03266 [Exophiala aquamarina CBS 119918]
MPGNVEGSMDVDDTQNSSGSKQEPTFESVRLAHEPAEPAEPASETPTTGPNANHCTRETPPSIGYNSDETLSDDEANTILPSAKRSEIPSKRPPTACRPSRRATRHHQNPDRAEYLLTRARNPRRAAIPGDDEAENVMGEAVAQQPRTVMPILPGFLRIVGADPRMKLRHDTVVVHINGEKYVRLDDANLVPARNVPQLVLGPNATIRHPENVAWTGERRNGRPSVLYLLFPKGPWEFKAENGRPKKPPASFRPEISHEYVMLNGHDKALKYSRTMPMKCSTDIEGWEMEALCRYDPTLCHQDFIDRMLANPPAGKSIPSAGTLNHRRRRDRLKMRVIPWPPPQKLSYSDQQVLKEVGNAGLANNSTWFLEDLTKEEIEMHIAITYGSHLERSGAKAQDYHRRQDRFRKNLKLVRSKYAEGSGEVGLVLGNIAVGLEKMGVEFKADEWDGL